MKLPILPIMKFSNPDVQELYETLRCVRYAIVNDQKRDAHIFMDRVVKYLLKLDKRIEKNKKENEQ